MSRLHRTLFASVRSEGGLIPSTLLERISNGDRTLDGTDPTSYHLEPGERINEAASRAWTRLLPAWRGFREACSKLPEKDTGTSVTRERWLLLLFQELGYGRLQPVRGAIEIEGRSFPISHKWGACPIHLAGFRTELDRRTAGVAGAARSSPHSLVQEYLNKVEESLWGYVSNGLLLRILRDNVSLTRQSFVEFDLEAMMEGEAYSDFVLLWMVTHQSRVEAGKPHECWLEKWSREAAEQGTRALDRLRDGVEEAIRALGGGFLSHPANGALREQLRSGGLTKEDYYRQILRLVYRLLFLFVAEDRGLLLDPKARVAEQDRYLRFYSTGRLRRLAERRCGSPHVDLYRGLRLVMEKLGDPEGCASLGLPVLGSFLWSPGAIGCLASSEIVNRDLLEAIRALAFAERERRFWPVDYRNLGAEELGSVYESLLELHANVDTQAGTFELRSTGGSERKTTGSYYTPSSLIACLLDSALDPVLAEAAKTKEPERAILDLRICDPACGSGHFLIAAAHRVAKRLAAVRTGDEEPSPDATRTALRDIIGHCIYGVDLNPMAVELCKVNLWMEALEPGKPLSFLDHRIQCGNSLLGTTPALMAAGIPDAAFTAIEGDDKEIVAAAKTKNKAENRGQQIDMMLPLVAEPPGEYLTLTDGYQNLDRIDDDSIRGIRRKEDTYRRLAESAEYRKARRAADAWCAAFIWRKVRAGLPAVTTDVLRRIETDPGGVSTALDAEVERLADQYGLFHWHLAFPDVFRVPHSGNAAENEACGWDGGFDVVLGNPPWERVKLQEKEWFAERNPEIANASNAAARKLLIEALKANDPGLYRQLLDDLRKAEGESHILRNSGRYPLCGRGDINVYTVFAEGMRTLLNDRGRVGCVLPTGIATDDTTKFFFQDVVEKRSLASLYDFENKGIFPAVDGRMKFCLFTAGRGVQPTADSAEFVFFAHAVEELRHPERRFTLSAEEVALVNPTSGTAPTFRSRSDALLNIAIYRRVSSFAAAGSWRPEFFKKMFDFGIHADLITFSERPPAEDAVGVYEAKMVHFFNHRASTYENASEADRRSGTARGLAEHELQDPQVRITPRCWVDIAAFNDRMAGRDWHYRWFLSMRDKARATDERTAIVGIRPYAPSNDTLPSIFLSQDARNIACVTGNLSAFVLDYMARQKVGGINFGAYIAEQLPVLEPSRFQRVCPWAGGRLNVGDWLVPRSLELTFTAYDLEQFALDCGWSGPPFRWDEERRFLLRCELDAAFFHLYLPAEGDGDWRQADLETVEDLVRLRATFAIPRDAVAYIMDTFPIVRSKDEAVHGEYRTKRVILEIYDEMAEAIRTGRPYQTGLNPPPGHPSCAHPPRDERATRR